MDWTQIKNSNDVKLAGIRVEVERTDKILRSITLTDGAGQSVKIGIDAYTLQVLVPAPVPTETKTVLVWETAGVRCSATVAGAPEEYDAVCKRQELERAGCEVTAHTVEEEIPF